MHCNFVQSFSKADMCLAETTHGIQYISSEPLRSSYGQKMIEWNNKAKSTLADLTNILIFYSQILKLPGQISWILPAPVLQ